MSDRQAKGRGRRLVRRVLVRPAARLQAALVIAIVLPYAWVERAWPPPEVRRFVVDLPEGTRALLLTVAWMIWLVGCLPATRKLLRSSHGAALRALPLGRRDWARALGPTLIAFQLPVALVVGYGLAPSGPGRAAAIGLALATAAALAQPHLTAARWRTVGLAWACSLCVPALAMMLGAGWTSLVAVVGAAALYAEGFRLPPAEIRTRRRWLRGARRPAWALAAPTVAAIVRGRPRLLFALVVVQVVLAVHLFVGLANGAADPGDALTAGVVWMGAAGAALLALVGRRRAASSAWYFESLPISRGLAVVALAIPAFVFATPAVAATSVATVVAVGRDGWTAAGWAWGVALWAGCFAAWVALDDDRRLRPARQVKWAAIAFAPVVTMVVTGRLVFALPFALLQGWMAWRLEPRARATRRRFELYREPETPS